MIVAFDLDGTLVNHAHRCRRGLPVKNGMHWGSYYNDGQYCTKHLYEGT